MTEFQIGLSIGIVFGLSLTVLGHRIVKSRRKEEPAHGAEDVFSQGPPSWWIDYEKMSIDPPRLSYDYARLEKNNRFARLYGSKSPVPLDQFLAACFGFGKFKEPTK